MKQSGMTLIEVLVAMFISVIVGGLLLVIMTNSAGLFTKQSSKVEEGLDVDDALMIIRKDIKQAGFIAASYTNGPTTYISGTTQLVLKIPSLDNSGNVISETYDYFVYFQNNKLLSYKVFPDLLSQRKSVDRILATGVKTIIFQYYDKNIPPNEVTPVSAINVKATLVLDQTIATAEASLRND